MSFADKNLYLKHIDVRTLTSFFVVKNKKRPRIYYN